MPEGQKPVYCRLTHKYQVLSGYPIQTISDDEWAVASAYFQSNPEAKKLSYACKGHVISYQIGCFDNPVTVKLTQPFIYIHHEIFAMRNNVLLSESDRPVSVGREYWQQQWRVAKEILKHAQGIEKLPNYRKYYFVYSHPETGKPVQLSRSFIYFQGEVYARDPNNILLGYGGFSLIKRLYSRSGHLLVEKKLISEKKHLSALSKTTQVEERLGRVTGIIYGSLFYFQKSLPSLICRYFPSTLKQTLDKFSNDCATYKDSDVDIVGSLWTLLSQYIQTAEKLSQLHQRHHVIHRDIKPGNIFISENGNVKLGDFGLSIQANSAGVSKGPHGVSGTMSYLAPEITGKAHTYSFVSDAYAFGVMLDDLVSIIEAHELELSFAFTVPGAHSNLTTFITQMRLVVTLLCEVQAQRRINIEMAEILLRYVQHALFNGIENTGDLYKSLSDCLMSVYSRSESKKEKAFALILSSAVNNSGYDFDLTTWIGYFQDPSPSLSKLVLSNRQVFNDFYANYLALNLNQSDIEYYFSDNHWHILLSYIDWRIFATSEDRFSFFQYLADHKPFRVKLASIYSVLDFNSCERLKLSSSDLHVFLLDKGLVDYLARQVVIDQYILTYKVRQLCQVVAYMVDNKIAFDAYGPFYHSAQALNVLLNLINKNMPLPKNLHILLDPECCNEIFVTLHTEFSPRPVNSPRFFMQPKVNATLAGLQEAVEALYKQYGGDIPPKTEGVGCSCC